VLELLPAAVLELLATAVLEILPTKRATLDICAMTAQVRRIGPA